MPLYRVSITNAVSGQPGEVLIEASDAAEARNIAASRGHRSASISSVADTEPVDQTKVIRRPEPFEPVPQPQQVTVLKIALGVFFGMTMFFLCIAFVGCAFGGNFYIG